MDKLKILREGFSSGVTKSLDFRVNQLKALLNGVTENEDAICNALQKDLNRHKHESLMLEVNVLKMEINYLIKNMLELAKPKPVAKSFITMTDSLRIQKQPFGVVLNISAWNYPILLLLQPLAGALAAGNCVLCKPSEISQASEEVLSNILEKYLDHRVCQVFRGGSEQTSELLKEKFDFIIYTGNSFVARKIMKSAADNLTPLILELGGKSPVYIDSEVNMKMASRRITWGKFCNNGQTCVAPDYLICHKSRVEELIENLKSCIVEFYGDNAQKSPCYCRIVNQKHFNRIQNLVNSSKGRRVYCGGEFDESDKFVPPLIFADVQPDDSLMREEIFGPVLPILTVDNEEQALKIILSKPKPLSVYVFTSRQSIMNYFEENTSSGGISFNEVILHAGVPNLPFGGVGESGMGNYHSEFSFDSFSHFRAVLDKDTKEMINNKLRYPPYTESKTSWMNWALSSSNSGKCQIM